MKPLNCLATTIAATVLLAVQAHASSIIKAESLPGAGVPYRFTVSMSGNDSGVFSNHVGAWSWEDNSLFGTGQPPVGWTHTSDWVALTLTEDTYFTINLAQKAGVPWPSETDPDRTASIDNMFPSLTIWSGLDMDGDQTDIHTFNNHGNVSWAEDITFLDYYDNHSAESIQRTWFLPAGTYTIVLGSNSPASEDSIYRQGYEATFTTSTVPEPSTTMTLLGGLSALALAYVRKRKK